MHNITNRFCKRIPNVVINGGTLTDNFGEEEENDDDDDDGESKVFMGCAGDI